MIDAMLAKRFIERISQFVSYNVNIMDEKGIIIASKNKSRIGTYHEVAMQIIHGDNDTIIVDNEIPQYGVKKGVNMAIYHKKRKEGVVGITGNPTEVMQIAMVIKMSVEVMLEHELLKHDKMKRRNLKEQLLNIVLYSENLEKGDWERYTKPLNLDENIIRIPILISIDQISEGYESILSAFRNGSNHSSQDLISLTRTGDILIYKAIKNNIDNLLGNYKFIVAESICDGLRYMRTANYEFHIYVGSFQSDFKFYRRGYEHCLWLKKNSGNEKSSFFYDYTNEYFMSVLPLTELQVVYNTIEERIGDDMKESFKEIMEALRKVNFNLTDASELLHIHRNTMVYRLNKLRDLMNMDPIKNNGDREFLNGFYNYLKRKEKIYKV